MRFGKRPLAIAAMNMELPPFKRGDIAPKVRPPSTVT